MRNVTVVLGTRARSEEVYGAFYDDKAAQEFRHWLREKYGTDTRTEATNLLEYSDEPRDFALMYRL